MTRHGFLTLALATPPAFIVASPAAAQRSPAIGKVAPRHRRIRQFIYRVEGA